MGGLVIEKVRDGVEFVPDAAAAFRRADAQVLREFGRRIDVNSTYRSWDQQMLMFTNWNRYVNGTGPYPGHSKAVHPSDSFHVSGLALDSDDWVNARIVEILAENGFIRNRLYVPNEKHHFEYIRSMDRNYGKPASGGNATPTPAVAPEEEDEDMPKNSGVWYKKDKSTYVYLVFNTGSGFAHEFSNGTNAGTMPGNYTAGLKASMDISSWSEVTLGHANVIKSALLAVRPKDAPREIEVTVVSQTELAALDADA